MTEYLSVLLKCPLFYNIPPEEIEQLLKCLQATIKTFRKSQVIFWAGQAVSHTALVLSGEVQLWEEDILGNRSIHNRFLSGETFGEVYACAKGSLMIASAVAVKPSEILFIDISRILGKHSCVGCYYGQLLENLLQITANRAQTLSRKVSVLSRRSLREKLLAYLSTQARVAQNCAFSIPYSRQELADYLSVDRSALSKELSKMKEEGLLDYHLNKFHLFPETCRCMAENEKE